MTPFLSKVHLTPVRGNCHTEIVGVGTIFPDADGKPSLHLHAALGRGDAAVAGCTRLGVDIWKVGEVVLVELLGSAARREVDSATGFSLLEP